MRTRAAAKWTQTPAAAAAAAAAARRRRWEETLSACLQCMHQLHSSSCATRIDPRHPVQHCLAPAAARPHRPHHHRRRRRRKEGEGGARRPSPSPSPRRQASRIGPRLRRGAGPCQWAHAGKHACMRACMRACVRACVCATSACVCVCGVRWHGCVGGCMPGVKAALQLGCRRCPR